MADSEERDGWETAIASWAGQANTYVEYLEENPSSAVDVLDQKTVASDPLVSDTDADDVDDLTEQINRLDPRSPDSDGDELSDRTELHSRDQSDEYAPAIYENTPPSVFVRSIVARNGRTEFAVSLQASDVSGLGAIDLLKKGEVEKRIWGRNETEVRKDVSFYVDRNLIEVIRVGAGDFFTSANVKIKAYDQHSNTRSQKFYGSDGFAAIAQSAANTPLPGGVGKREAVQLMGFSSGVKTSGKQAATDLYSLARHPKQSADQMAAVGGYIANNHSVLAELPGMMADQVASKQARINPFTYGGETSAFAESWYLGYVTGSGISMAVGDKGTSAIVGRLSQSSTRVGSAMRALQGAKTSLKASVSTKTMALAGRVARKSPDIDTAKVANRLSEVSKPVRHRTTRQLGELKDSTWNIIERNGYEGQAVKVLRTGTKGKAALDALGDSGKRNLLKLADDVATERAIIKAWENRDISRKHMAKALARVEDMSPSERRIYKQVARATGDDAVEVVAKSDGPAWRAMATDGGEGIDFREGVARAADSDSIDSFDQLDRAVRKVENLDGDANVRARELVDETDGKDLAFVDDVDSGTLNKVLDSSDASIDEIAGAVRKYDRLDSSSRSQFRKILADDDVRDSWVKSVSSEAIDSRGVRKALDDVEYLRSQGYEPTSFSPGQQLAEGDEFYETWYGSDYWNPVDEDSIAIDAH